MRLKISLSLFPLLILMLLVTGCGMHNGNPVEEYNDFGVKCAKMGLWNEATMRWKHIIEKEPGNAPAHNNLGVAYESKGKFASALAEYKQAIELDPENKAYKSNYKKFKKHYERASKKAEAEKK